MALINLRNALMAGKRLPYDAEVEYLQSSGTQYIDTLVNADSNMSVEITMANAGTPWANANPTGAILVLTSSQTRHHLNFSGYGVNYYYGNISTANVQTHYTPGDLVPFTFKVDAVNKIFTLGDYSIALPTYAFDTGLSYWLFGRNGTTPPYLGSLRIYSAKLWNGSTLVRDYIPVRVGTVGYLYDRVSGKLFGNAGTGDFVLGPDVVPVEYIESHGTEYIDTGVSATGATNSEFQFKMSVAGFAFGARTAWNASAYSLNYGTGNYAFNYGNNGVVATLTTNIPIDTNWHTAKIQTAGVLSLDEWTSTAGTYSFTTNGSLVLFGMRQGYSLYLTASVFKYCKIWESSALVRSLRPIRVGTEGAMMDTLTRRIYRNAGTGAFTYGNDLKYPIAS